MDEPTLRRQFTERHQPGARVTVIIATNGERDEFLKQATESVKNQTTPVDLIIVTGPKGPWSDTNNLYEKWNKGIAKCKTPLFIPLCDDDWLDTTYAEKTIGRMDRQQYDIVGTPIECFGTHPGVHGPSKLPFVTALCKKEYWERVGGYDERGLMCADYDFWWMCYDAGAQIGYVDEPLLKYRKHPGQVSNIGDWQRDVRTMWDKHGGNQSPY